MAPHHTSLSPADANLLSLLTGDRPPTQSIGAQARHFARRDAPIDPLLLAAAAASGPHMTRNHYAHDFFPGVRLPEVDTKADYSQWSGQDASAAKENRQKREKAQWAYVSRQAPRRQRLGLLDLEKKDDDSTTAPKKEHLPLLSTPDSLSSSSSVQVKCMARTRIPTPHGPIFLHLYHNNRDNKEHLAFVVDPAQLEANDSSAVQPPHIRSTSLDAIWNPSETHADRLLRGAYVGRLSKTTQMASAPTSGRPTPNYDTQKSSGIPPPMIRIHSECFTGENIGSMRCDCGEQLDEAIRRISQPLTVPHSRIPGRGAVIYMRQEGRGIGLLSKIQAYNLQDMGHDTVSANLMLGHKADERGYQVAAAILRDLGLDEGVRILTNNPDKIQALESEGVKIVERVPMVPRSWQTKHFHNAEPPVTPPEAEGGVLVAGATMIGGGAVNGPDLDNYLRTKILKMGHVLPLWMAGDSPDGSIIGSDH